MDVIRTLAQKGKGLTRGEIIEAGKLSSGGGTTQILEELTESGFITPYIPFNRNAKDSIFKLTDEYSLFYIKFIENSRSAGSGTWIKFSTGTSWKSWSAFAFESICMKHTVQIKKALGIGNVYTETSVWRYKPKKGEQGAPQIDLLIDRWAAHFGCDASGHQICLAHLFRDLNYIEQVHQSNWAGSLKAVLKDAIRLSKQAGYDGLSDCPARNKIEQSLLNLLQHRLPDKDKLAIRLQKKLRKISHNILCFLHYNHVPPDNNGAERAIRTIKVKQKVSGGFRSIDGADGFAVIRSVIDTTLKSGQELFLALALIANFSPE